MIFAIALSGIFLFFLGVTKPDKFRLYGLLTALIYTVLSIELIADINGLTLSILAALTIISLPFAGIKLYDIIGWLLITLPCTFWLGTQEFVDGFANSHILIALGVALACYLVFDKQKRQALCALVILTGYVICYASRMYFNAVDIATSFLAGIIFTQRFELNRAAIRTRLCSLD